MGEGLDSASAVALLIAWAVLAVATLSRGIFFLRAAVALLALAGLIASIAAESWLLALLQAAVLGAAVALLASGRWQQMRARFSDEERTLAASLNGLSPASARHLIDQGFWLNARTGEQLTREGEAIPHLYFLGDGEARVTAGEREVGHCDPGNFIGEVTALSGEPATATVTLASPARLWCIPADRLRETVAIHQDVRVALEAAFRKELTAKLVAANRAMAESKAA